MSLETTRRKLHFRCWHRGTKESDLLLGSFADSFINKLTADELDQLDNLLDESDPDLYNWITKKKQVPANISNNVLEKIINFYNK